MIIETERLILRPITISDALDVYEYAKNENVGKNAGFKPHESVEETKSIINGILKVNSLAIFLKEINKVIGVISLEEKLDKIYELGYSLGEAYWHKGYCFEACKALIKYAFNSLNAYEIDAGTFLDNYRSEKLLLNLGFKYVGIHKKDYLNYDNKYLDCKRFRLTKNDYMEECLWK